MFLTSKRLRSDASPPSSPLDNVSKRRRRDTTWPPSSSSSSSRPLPAEEHGLPEDPSPSTWANHRPYYPQSSQSFSQQQQHGGSSTSNPFGYNAIPLPSPLGFPSVINASSSSSFCSDTPPILLTDLPNNPNPADARPQSSYPQQTPDNLSLSQQNGYFPPTSSGPCTGGGGGSGGEQPLSQSSSIARMPWSGSTSQSGEIVGRVGERGRGAAAGGMRMEESPYAPMNQVLHDLHRSRNPHILSSPYPQTSLINDPSSNSPYPASSSLHHPPSSTSSSSQPHPTSYARPSLLGPSLSNCSSTTIRPSHDTPSSSSSPFAPPFSSQQTIMPFSPRPSPPHSCPYQQQQQQQAGGGACYDDTNRMLGNLVLERRRAMGRRNVLSPGGYEVEAEEEEMGG